MKNLTQANLFEIFSKLWIFILSPNNTYNYFITHKHISKTYEFQVEDEVDEISNEEFMKLEQSLQNEDKSTS